MRSEVPTYRRDQVERAIAGLSGRISNAQYRPEPSLKADLKRLLDLDRSEGKKTQKGPRSRYAFFDAGPPGKGVNQDYSFEAAFALFAAERLLRAGLTQHRALMRIRTVRPALDRKVKEIAAVFGTDQNEPHPSRPGLRYQPSPSEMIFWITRGGPAADLELEPPLFCSAEETRAVLVESSFVCDPVISIELVGPVHKLRQWLARMPVRNRGRS